MDKQKKIILKKDFLSSLHSFVYDNSNSLIGIGIDIECKKFIKALKKCNYENNNQ